MNEKIFLGFTKNGKPVRHKAPHLNTDCYNFQKMEVLHNETVKSHKMQMNRGGRKRGMGRRMQEQNERRRHESHSRRIGNVPGTELQPHHLNCTHDVYPLKKHKLKKVTNTNSGIVPKFRHDHHQRRNRKNGRLR